MRLKVERKHITKGNQGEAESCALALALNDQIKQAFGGAIELDEVRVGGSTSTIIIPAQTITFNNSRAATKFIENFDDNKKSVRPTTLNLEPRWY